MRRCFIFVRSEDVSAANALAASFEVSPATAPVFSVPLYPASGGETATHFGCCPDPGPELTNALPVLTSTFVGSD